MWIVLCDRLQSEWEGNNYSSAVLFRSSPNSRSANSQCSNASSGLPSCNCLIHSSKWRSVSKRLDRFILANTGDIIFQFTISISAAVIITNDTLRMNRKVLVEVTPVISFRFIKRRNKLTDTLEWSLCLNVAYLPQPKLFHYFCLAVKKILLINLSILPKFISSKYK